MNRVQLNLSTKDLARPITIGIPVVNLYGARKGRATMVTIGVVAGVIVAAGTLAGGTKLVVTYIYDRGRKAEREAMRKAKLEADLEELKKRRGE